MTPRASKTSAKPGAKRSFASDFREFFLRGLAILLPSVLTIWLLVAAYGFVQRNIAEPINASIRQAVLYVAPKVVPEERLPDWFSVPADKVHEARDQRALQGLRPLPEPVLRAQIRERNFAEYWNAHWYLQVIGLVAAIILFYLAGVLLGGFIGRRIYSRIEGLLTRIPLIKQVYPSVKQVTEFLFGEKNQLSFNRVVIVEYPRPGIWSLGFHTGNTLRSINRRAGVECVSVFIPSSPTPFTGYAINLPKDEVFDVNMTVEEALRFVISGGVLVADAERDDLPPSRTPGLAGSVQPVIMAPRPAGQPSPSDDQPLNENRT
jgi:uncharacterized membrane protein